MKSFNNKVVVITGAGSGMGRSYAIEFAKLGAKLALNDYDQASLVETTALAEASGAKVVYAEAFDVSNKDAMYKFAASSKKALGNAHVVINNAGIEGGSYPAFSLGEDDYHRVMNINFFGVLYGTKAFLPQLVENDEGAVVNVSSIFGLIGTPNSSSYCAAKFAVRGFTESLMVEFHKSPISIHCLHPGGIATNIANASENQEFNKQYLTTPPEKIVKHVITCIQRKKLKIVYGNDSFKTWLGAKFVPTNILNGIIWAELKKVLDLTLYSKFLKKI